MTHHGLVTQEGPHVEPTGTGVHTRRPFAERHAHEPLPLVPLRNGVFFCVVLFLSLRALFSLAGVVGVGAAEPDPSEAWGPPPSFVTSATPGFHNAWDGMDRWDAPWFLWIANTGWGQGPTIAYSPGYPSAINLVDRMLPGNGLPAALLISNLAYLGALIVLFATTSMERGSERAPWAVFLFTAFPGALFFFAPYSDAPFLLMSLLCLRWARAGRWPLAAVAGVAACLFRNIGVALAPALLIEAWTQTDGYPRRHRTAYAASVALGPLIPLLISTILGYGVIEPLNAQRYWGRVATFPVVTIGRGLGYAIDAVVGRGGIFYLVDAIPVALVLLLAVLAIKRLPPTYSWYVWISLLIPLSFPQPGHPFISLTRYAAVLFPLSWVALNELRRRRDILLVSGISLAFEVGLAVWFMNWGAVV
jgi:hypothetical protein